MRIRRYSHPFSSSMLFLHICYTVGFCFGKNGKGIYIRVHAKSWKKAKDKLRMLTSRSRCGSIVKTMEKIKVFMRGWLNYIIISFFTGSHCTSHLFPIKILLPMVPEALHHLYIIVCFETFLFASWVLYFDCQCSFQYPSADCDPAVNQTIARWFSASHETMLVCHRHDPVFISLLNHGLHKPWCLCDLICIQAFHRSKCEIT